MQKANGLQPAHMTAQYASGIYKVENSSSAFSRYPTKVTYLFPAMEVIRPECHPAWIMGAGLAYLLRATIKAATHHLLDQPAWEEKGRLPVWVMMGAGQAYLLRATVKAATHRLLEQPAWEEKEQLLI